MIQTEVNCNGNYFQTCSLYLLILLTGKAYFLGLCISKIHVDTSSHFSICTSIMVMYIAYVTLL